MTKEQLINDGWKPELCLIGTLYFKEDYFCRLDNDTAIVFSKSNDMVPLGKAKTFDEIKNLQKTHEETSIALAELQLNIMKDLFMKKYGVAPKPITLKLNNENH